MPAIRFKQARLARGWSLKEMAARLNVTPETVSQWERGKYDPSLEKVALLAEVTGFSIPYLLGYDSIQENLKAPISAAALAVMHALPIWTREHGWGLVNGAQKRVILADGSSLPLEDIAGEAYGIPPAFALPIYGFGEPLQLDALPRDTRVWVEPISRDEALRDELRGWYRPKNGLYVESEFGHRFYLDTYGAKWLAFGQPPGGDKPE